MVCLEGAQGIESMTRAPEMRGIEDKSDYFSYFSTKTHVVTPHQNCVNETFLMMDNKICFHEEIWLIIPKSSLLPLLIWSTASLHPLALSLPIHIYRILKEWSFYMK